MIQKICIAYINTDFFTKFCTMYWLLRIYNDKICSKESPCPTLVMLLNGAVRYLVETRFFSSGYAKLFVVFF